MSTPQIKHFFGEKMAIIVSISGVQGSGKSTLQEALAEIQNPNLSIYSDTFKVSRAVQQRLGYQTLNEAIATVDNFIKFQREIIHEKDRSLSLLKSAISDVALTERSFIDIAAYNHLWISKFVERGVLPVDEGIALSVEYTTRCLELQKYHFTSNIIVPKMAYVEYEFDPNRADESLSDMFFEVYMNILMESGQQAFIISKQTVDDRVGEATKYLESLINV